MIEIEKVCVDFSAGRGPSTRAVDDVSLRIGAGEIFGIVGTSGAGKSTLLRTLNALTRPSQGSVKVNGVEISALEGVHLRKARQRIGMIFQHFNLMHTRTVAQNVAFSLKAAGWERSKIGPRVSEILSLVGLSDKANRFPVQLSGGQKQRVGIARALMPNPEVLVLDEPTSGLDLGGRESLLQTLSQLAHQPYAPVLILVTHHVEEIPEGFTHALLLRDGKKFAAGPIEEIVTSENLSQVFGLPLVVSYEGGRFTAKAVRS